MATEMNLREKPFHAMMTIIFHHDKLQLTNEEYEHIVSSDQVTQCPIKKVYNVIVHCF